MLIVNLNKSNFFENVWDGAFAQAAFYWKRNHIFQPS